MPFFFFYLIFYSKPRKEASFKEKVAQSQALVTHSFLNILSSCMCVCLCVYLNVNACACLYTYVLVYLNVCVSMCMETAKVGPAVTVTSSVTLGKSLITHPRLSLLICKMTFTADFSLRFEG